MPSSNPQNISRILETVIALRPQSVLDIGVGTGKLGFLLREYLDLGVFGDGERWPPARHARIDGIEGHAAYVGDIQRSVYDDLHIGEAQTILPTLETTYDLVMMIDVLEHFSEEDAREVMKQTRRISTHVLAVVPVGTREQGNSCGNPLERHRMSPTRGLMHELGFKSVQRRNGSFFASYPSARSAVVRYRSEYRARNLVRRLPESLQRPVTAVGKRALSR